METIGMKEYEEKIKCFSETTKIPEEIIKQLSLLGHNQFRKDKLAQLLSDLEEDDNEIRVGEVYIYYFYKLNSNKEEVNKIKHQIAKELGIMKEDKSFDAKYKEELSKGKYYSVKPDLEALRRLLNNKYKIFDYIPENDNVNKIIINPETWKNETRPQIIEILKKIKSEHNSRVRNTLDEIEKLLEV